MVGGNDLPHRDVIQREISRVLVLNLLWQSKRCSRTAEEIFVLDNALALIEGQPSVGKGPKGWASPPKKMAR